MSTQKHGIRRQDMSLTEGLACPQSTLAGCLSSAFCVQHGVALHTIENQALHPEELQDCALLYT